MGDTLQTVLDSLDLVVFLVLIGLGYFLGRRNERRHLADLAQRERQLQGVATFATRYPPIHATVHDPLLVSGSAVIAADSFKMFVAGLRKLVGGRFAAYETLVDRARREAILRMKAQAQAAGCPMIFNVRVETTQLMAGNRGGATAVEVFAYGTAFAPAAGSVTESNHTYIPGPELQEKEGFDLRKNVATRWLLIAMATLLVLSWLELTFFGDFWYVESAPWGAFFGVAALSSAGAIVLMRRHGVPRNEMIGLGLLLVLALPFLFYYPALRLNAFTDTRPLAEQVFLLNEDRSLSPVTGEGPVLRFPDDVDYWQGREPGSEHRFVVRRGWLGFWEVANETYLDELRAFNRARWEQKDAARKAPTAADEAHPR